MNILRRLKNSLGFKFSVIGVLLLLFLIPVEMLSSLVQERFSKQWQVFQEISSTMGGQQTVGGLILSVPFKSHRYKTSKYQDGSSHVEDIVEIKLANFLPEELQISGGLRPEIRHRSLFKVLVYFADLKLSGTFKAPDFERLDIAEEDILWERAFLSLPISDTIGIRKTPILKWGEEPLLFGPVSKILPGLESVIQAKPQGIGDLKNGKSVEFSLELILSGSQQLSFLPHGRETQIKLNSEWSTPSFNGAYLPIERSVEKNGFDAHWHVLELSRGYPQQWIASPGLNNMLNNGSFGVKLLFPVSIYQQTTRSIKYSFLFIILTFLIFFLFEVFGRLRIHPLQYSLVGFGLCIFYLNLLSLSEHISFGWAYLAASFSSTLLITGYSAAVLKQRLRAGLMGLFLLALYAFLYLLLKSESYSLLLGSLGLSFILGTVMFTTRKIDWYQINREEPQDQNL